MPHHEPPTNGEKRRVVVTLDVPADEGELLEILENIDYVVGGRMPALFRPPLLELLAQLREELEGRLWTEPGPAS